MGTTNTYVNDHEKGFCQETLTKTDLMIHSFSQETFTRETCTSPYELWVIIFPHLGQCMWRRLLCESHPEIFAAFLGLVGAAGFGFSVAFLVSFFSFLACAFEL